MKAFSLVELIVVIAIVGILAAIAAPSYQQYLKRAKLDTVVPVIADLGNKVKEFYDKNGTFPNNVSQIGFPASFQDTPNTVDEYAIPPYIAEFTLTGNDYAPGSCANFTVQLTVSNFSSEGAYTTSSLPHLNIFQVYTLKNNIWVPFCYYNQYSNTGVLDTITTSMIANCYNIVNPDDFNAINEYLTLTNSCP